MIFFLKFSSAKNLIKDQHLNYAVNMQDGGLILKEESDFTVNIDRTYRSRSLNHGFFGQGWCSDIESEIIFQGRGVIRLINCQSSRPSLFNINKTASAYINVDNPEDQILIKLGYYERQIQHEWISQYNFKGKLVQYRKNLISSKLIYNTRLLPVKIISGSKILTLKWHPILDLIEEVSSNGKSETLIYSGFNLIKVQSNLKTLTYQYDDLDNLISRSVLGKLADLNIEYDKSLDQVLKIKNECVESYSYTKKSAKRSLATVNKVCPRTNSSKTEFIFEYAENLNQPIHITVNKLSDLVDKKVSLNQVGEL